MGTLISVLLLKWCQNFPWNRFSLQITGFDGFITIPIQCEKLITMIKTCSEKDIFLYFANLELGGYFSITSLVLNRCLSVNFFLLPLRSVCINKITTYQLDWHNFCLESSALEIGKAKLMVEVFHEKKGIKLYFAPMSRSNVMFVKQ